MEAKSKVLIDTNMLLLLMLAHMRRDPAKHKRLSAYRDYDLNVITEYLESFNSFIATPNVLTEASNMLEGFQEKAWLANYISRCEETYLPSCNFSNHPDFQYLGLTDLVLGASDFAEVHILTDDLQLANHLLAYGRKVDYYQDLRKAYRANRGFL